jgi:hypothetical protein
VENLFSTRERLSVSEAPLSKWLVSYFLRSILMLERRTWEENIEMNCTEVEWECVGCIELVHCTPLSRDASYGQPDEIPVDHILLPVFGFTTQKV